MFMFDIETAGMESTAVVLSAAIIEFDLSTDFSYGELLKRSLFVKFDAAEQIRKYKRITDPETIKWWEGQPQAARALSLIPNADLDKSVEEGMSLLRGYYKNTPSKNKTIWVRGSLDQLAIDSLARVADVSDVAHFTAYRDVRTFIDLMTDTASNGYCNIPDFDRDQVVKHDPVHDCAYDIFMMRYGQ